MNSGGAKITQFTLRNAEKRIPLAPDNSRLLMGNLNGTQPRGRPAP
ncbi:hypothetical protein CSC17_0840 [Klebsiella oxytoca]|nr:hypothetical protein CSC17_0840 [Klebsiella oxytoca]